MSYQNKEDGDFYAVDGEEILANNNGLDSSSKSMCSRPLKMLAAMGCVLGSLFVFYSSSEQYSETRNFIKSAFSSSSSSFAVELSATSPDYPTTLSLSYLPWSLMVEPYRNQYLEITSFTLDGEDTLSDLSDSSLYEVKWTVDDVEYSGNPAVVNVERTGVFDNTVTITDLSTGEEYTHDFELASKYIRREIRSLSADDLETFIQTMHLLYSTSQEDGRAMYGEKFNNAETFLYYHLNGAGRTDCDHWHDGGGIVTHHMAFTLLAEQSLQAINPAISMPYWEYAMDEYMYDNWWDSAIFSESAMGKATPDTADHSVLSGQWANISLPSGEAYLDWDISEEGSLNPFVNAYGVMRSAWNNNPSPYIGRYNMTYDYSTTTMPSCELMYDCYRSGEYKQIADCLNGVTHGPVHILIGGTWGQGDLFDDRDISFLQGIDKLLFFKMLWRSGFTRCPTSCEVSDDPDACVCAVPDEYIETYGAQSMMEQAGIWDIAQDHLTGASDEVMLKALRAMEDPGIAGEMFSSGASYDPSFWPVHGQIERLLSRKRIQAEKGVTQFDATWGYSTANYRFLAGECDWTGVTSVEDLTLPTCNISKAIVCSGHNAEDVLEFANFIGTDTSYTNSEFIDFIHPWNDDLPYTYDTFDFDYCTPEGYDFDS